MEFNVTLIPGDGIGPEIVREARKVLDRVAENMDTDLHIRKCLWVAVQ